MLEKIGVSHQSSVGVTVANVPSPTVLATPDSREIELGPVAKRIDKKTSLDAKVSGLGNADVDTIHIR